MLTDHSNENERVDAIFDSEYGAAAHAADITWQIFHWQRMRVEAGEISILRIALESAIPG
jgi:hypothetical protein